MADEFKIEKGVPMSPRGKFPFPEMEVGDSFLAPWNDDDHARQANNVQTVAGAYGRRHEMRFSLRTVEGGVRVWRIA